MAAKVIMPKQGLQMTEGNIIEWLVSEGDVIEEGQPLFEMETDKLTITIDAPATGRLLKIIHDEGSVVPVTQTIAIIGDEGEDISGLLAEAQAAEEPLARSGSDAPTAKTDPPASETVNEQSGDRLFSTPRARWRAESVGIDLADVLPTGPDSLIIERDVLSSSAATPGARIERSRTMGGVSASPNLSTDEPRPDRSVPLTGMRATIARRMRESLDNAAQAVHRIAVDMSEVVRMREMLKHSERKVSYNDIVLKATANALLTHPRMNSSLEGDVIKELGRVNIGIAVAITEGLIVPVLKDVDRLDLVSIHSEAKRLSEAARTGALNSEELSGATFTVSNLGMFGLDSFTAIIDTPQSGILAVGAIKDHVVPFNGAPTIKPICELTLTYDHRVVDGAPAAAFLRDVADILENPYLLI